MCEFQTLLMDKKVCVGVDGYGAGWFAIALTEAGDFDTVVFSEISDLWNYFCGDHTDVHICLDIPIGLIDRSSSYKRRPCDAEARKLLAPKRHPSVFTPPCREALHAESYESACDINEEVTGIRLTKQLWGIVPKIREVDDFLVSAHSAQENIKEIHPEICFWAFAGKPMEDSKKKNEVFIERKKILQEICNLTDRIVQNSLDKYNRKDVARDDILDALVASLTAKLSFEKGLKSVPQNPGRDSKDLPMQMVYTTVC
jgi:predicted RNase H-like nuclease